MFGNGYVILSHTLLGMWLLIHTDIHVIKRGSWGQVAQNLELLMKRWAWWRHICLCLYYLSPRYLYWHFTCWILLLTHWGQVTHICLNKLTIIGSDNGLSPGRRQAILWTNAGILLIGPRGNSETFIKICTFSFKKIHLKMSSAKRRPFCLGLNMLRFTLQGVVNMLKLCS